MTTPTYETLNVTFEDHIAHVELNRPDKANAMDSQMWTELKNAFEWVDQTKGVRVVVLSGKGKLFTAGLDLSLLMELGSSADKEKCEGRKRENLRRKVLELQECLSVIEKCRHPVIAAIHNGCIGGGVDMTANCCMRYCTADAYFVIKEIDLAITADVGTLQRLPHLIPSGMMREMAYTGRKVFAEEAMRIGLVNQIFEDKETLMKEVMVIAKTVASKSPLAIRGTKEMLLYTRDHSVQDALNYVATWNAAMVLSEDIQEAMMSQMQKREPEYKD